MASHHYGDPLAAASSVGEDDDSDGQVPAGVPANAADRDTAPNVGGGEGGEGGAGDERDLRACFGAKNEVLVQYVDFFEAEGFDDIELVGDMDASDCKSVLEELDKVSIKKPHRKKLAKVLDALTGGGGDGGGGDNDDAGGVDVETWLTSVHKSLTPYAKVFTEMGYDNFDLIRDIDAGDRDDILAALDAAEIKKVRACWAHSLSYAYAFDSPPARHSSPSLSTSSIPHSDRPSLTPPLPSLPPLHHVPPPRLNTPTSPPLPLLSHPTRTRTYT